MARVHGVVRKNAGSAVIEMTLLIPILMGCFFMYVLFFLFFIENAKGIGETTVSLYEQTSVGKMDKGKGIKNGNTITASFENHDQWFDFTFQIKRNGRDALKSIRRWQLVTSKI